MVPAHRWSDITDQKPSKTTQSAEKQLQGFLMLEISQAEWADVHSCHWAAASLAGISTPPPLCPQNNHPCFRRLASNTRCCNCCFCSAADLLPPPPAKAASPLLLAFGCCSGGGMLLPAALLLLPTPTPPRPPAPLRVSLGGNRAAGAAAPKMDSEMIFCRLFWWLS
jgi:hypothetical protein